MGKQRSLLRTWKGRCKQCKKCFLRESSFASYCNVACKMKAYRLRIKNGVHLQPRKRRLKAAKRRHPRRAR
jgi:hypothetical protein